MKLVPMRRVMTFTLYLGRKLEDMVDSSLLLLALGLGCSIGRHPLSYLRDGATWKPSGVHHLPIGLTLSCFNLAGTLKMFTGKC